MIINNINNFKIEIKDEIVKGLKYLDIYDYIYHIERCENASNIEELFSEDLCDLVELMIPITYGGIDNIFYSIKDKALDEAYEMVESEYEYEYMNEEEDENDILNIIKREDKLREREYRMKSDALGLFFYDKLAEEIDTILENIIIN